MRSAGWAMTVLWLVACAAPQPRSDYAQVEAPASAPAPLDLDANLARLSEWFAGEWDNRAQVQAEQEQGGVSPGARHEHVHAMFLPVSVPAIGGSVFFARQTLDDDPKRVFRLRLYRFAVDRDAIRLDQYSFADEARWREAHRNPESLATLTQADLRYAPDCAVWFRWDEAAQEFVGSTREGACKVASERLGRAVIVEDRLQLGAGHLWILSRARDEAGRLVYGNADGVPHKQQRVRWFTGLVAVNRAGPAARPEDREFLTLRDVVLHSEGRSVPIVWSDGRRSGWSVQLVRSVVRGEALLALNLIEDATGRTLAYAWTDPVARRIGLNLRWFQADFREVQGDARFDPALNR